MNYYDEKQINSLIRYCRMYLYASSGNPETMMNEIARNFFEFGLFHLIATMFITKDSRSDSNGGVFHRILDPLGKGSLLFPIDNILDSQIGETTLRQYIRSKRNKLAVHGLLNFSSQPIEVQDVTFDENSLRQFEQSMYDFDEAVAALLSELENFEK